MPIVSATPRLVSVIIPVYNRFELAHQTIESVFSQDYRPIEVIIVDDCSDSLFNLESIVPPSEISIQIIHLTNNVGPGAAREAGRLQAHGEFICYLDSDDLCSKEKIRRQVETLSASPETGMCYCVTREFKDTPFDENGSIRIRSDQNFPNFLPTVLYGRPWSTSACMWRRWATDRIGSWFPGRVWEDYEYDCRAGCDDIPIIFLPEVLCYYRCRETKGDPSLNEIRQKKLFQTPSLIQMAQNLDRFGKFEDPIIYKRLTSLLYSTGLWLIIVNENGAGHQCLNQILHISKTNWGMKIWLRLVSIAQKLLHTNLPARLARRLDRFVGSRVIPRRFV